MVNFVLAPFIVAPLLKVGAMWCACVFMVGGLFFPFDAVVAETTMELRYEVQWGNVNIGEAEASWTFTQNRFEIVGKSKTVGISDKLRKYRGSSKAEGQIHHDVYRSVRIDTNGIYKGTERNANVIWNADDSQISTIRSPALDLKKVFPLRDEVVQGSIGPYTAMLRALHTIKQTGSCNSSYKIYDGLRTAEVRLHDLGHELLTADRLSAYSGVVIKCGLTSTPTGGQRLTSRWNEKKRNSDDIIIFIAETEPSLFLPVRIEVKTFIGKVTARLVMNTLSIKSRQ